MAYTLKPRVVYITVQAMVGEYDKGGRFVRMMPGNPIQVGEAEVSDVFQKGWIDKLLARVRQLREGEEEANR